MKGRLSKQEVSDMLDKLEIAYPTASCELNYSSVFELLVAVILSAQCTDKRVNIITAKLFEKCNTPQAMAEMPVEVLEKFIFSAGFYHNKAKNIISCSKDIVEKFDGKVPNNIDDLTKLAGVGRKTANVVYSEAFGGAAIAVDTHVLRLANRLNIVESDSPVVVERALNEIIDKGRWSKAHHLFIFHGRYTCKSAKPLCGQCSIAQYCNYSKKKI